MYNCEKCVHEELCDQPSRQLWGHLTKETDCSDFKDRTNYVEVVRCKDCKHRGDDVSCPMCYEEEIERDDDGYTEADWIHHDLTHDEGFCDRGEREDNG